MRRMLVLVFVLAMAGLTMFVMGGLARSSAAAPEFNSVANPAVNGPQTDPAIARETIVVLFRSGIGGIQTQHSFSGPVTVTVAGVGQASGPSWSDAFYVYTDWDGNPITPVHPIGLYNYTLWINDGPADAFVSPIPPYNPAHVYTFSITAPGGPLRFAVGDVQSGDNSGQYTITVTPQLVARRFTSPPTLDGYLDDWPATDIQVLDASTANYIFGQVPSNTDASSTIRAGWDSAYLYFAMEANDDIFIADSEEMWRDDNVAVGLDGANDDTGNNADDHQLIVAADGRFSDFGSAQLDGVQVSVRSTTSGYVIEMAVARSLVGGTLSTNRLIGLNIGLSDDDDGGLIESWLVWAGQNTSQDQVDFIDLHLLSSTWTPSTAPTSHWSQVTSSTSAALRAVQMRSSGEGWAVGAAGEVLRYQGMWQDVTIPETRDLYAVFMPTSDTGWMAGAGGAIWKYDHGSWISTTSPVSERLWDIDMLSENAGWMIGTGGVILHYSGATWTRVSSPSTTRSGLGMDMVSSNDGWIVGEGGLIWHFDGAAWTIFTSPTARDLYDVSMISPTEGWAVGQAGVILYYKNGAWRQWGSPTSTTLLAVKMATVDDGWATGDGGVILRYNGRGWSQVASPTTRNLDDVAVLNTFNAWAVGQNGTILHFSPPGAPTETPTPMPTNTPVTNPVVDIILPAQPTACTVDSLIWETIAYNPSVGTTNGAGIDQVVFRILDNNNTLVYEKAERRTKYCGFGGDTACYALSLSNGTWHADDNSQTVSGPILVGMTYTMRATAYSTQAAGGASASDSVQMTVENCPTATPTSTSTPTRTPTATSTSTPTRTSTPTNTPVGLPNLSASVKSASPTVVAYFEEITYTITVRNTGSAAASVDLSDSPPLPYVTGSAVGGIYWDDAASLIRWQGTIAAGDSRIFQFRVHGPTPPIAHNTIYTNDVTLNDGVNPPVVRSVDVLANPEPTPTATPTATPTLTPGPRYLYLPAVLK